MVSDNQECMSFNLQTFTITAHTTIHKILHTQYHAFHKQHLQKPRLHHLPLLHHKTETEKVTEYHNITLTHILILIGGE